MLTNIISPYRKPVYKSIAKECDLTVFYDAITEFDRTWKLSHDDIKSVKTKGISFKDKVTNVDRKNRFEQILTRHMPFSLLWQLPKFKPDVVISLELGFRTFCAALYCTLFRKNLIIWSYQSRVSYSQSKDSKLRKLWRILLLSRAKKVIGMGVQAREVLEDLSLRPEDIVDIPNAANHEYFDAALSDPLFTDKIDAIKERYSYDKKIAIVVGRLIPLKGIRQLIESWNGLPYELKEEWKLLFVGIGPLEDIINEQDINHIELAGEVDIAEVPYWYFAADLHIFPTRGDVWGLVVNEASMCATPTLCSQYAGCSDDLIEEGITGIVYRPDDYYAASYALKNALQDDYLEDIGLQAQKKINPYTTERMADTFLKLIHRYK